MSIDVLMPGKERAIVIKAKIMDIFDNEEFFCRLANLGRGGNYTSREDISIKKWIGR